jgi:hypothetical protein
VGGVRLHQRLAPCPGRADPAGIPPRRAVPGTFAPEHPCLHPRSDSAAECGMLCAAGLPRAGSCGALRCCTVWRRPGPHGWGAAVHGTPGSPPSFRHSHLACIHVASHTFMHRGACAISFPVLLLSLQWGPGYRPHQHTLDTYTLCTSGTCCRGGVRQCARRWASAVLAGCYKPHAQHVHLCVNAQQGGRSGRQHIKAGNRGLCAERRCFELPRAGVPCRTVL